MRAFSRHGMLVQQDEGHPNWTVERLLDMSSEELSQDVDRTMENAWVPQSQACVLCCWPGALASWK